MHPSLRLSALEVLPFTTRRIALSAARGNVKDVYNVHRRIKVESCDAASVFIPVFYACLDVARIPSGELLEVPSTFMEGAVPCADISLQSLYSMVLSFKDLDPIHPDAVPELWPRLWAWVQFIDTYREQFPEDGAAGSEFINLVLVFTSFYKPHLAATPGLRRVMARAWAPILRCANPVRVVLGMEALTTTLFSVLKLRNRSDTEEIVEGAGGSLANLADLVVGYLDRITFDRGTQQLPVNYQQHRFDGTIFDFINDVDHVMAQGTSPSDGNTLAPFASALLSCGVVTSLTELLKTFFPAAATQFQDFPPLLHRSLVALNQILFTAPTGRKAMMDALHAGLLQVIVLCGTRSDFVPPLKSLVENVLQSTLVHYYEVLHLETHIPAAVALIQRKSFQDSSVSEAWNRFLVLASERVAILHTVDNESRLKACDNAKCDKIDISTHFQRCSGCLSFYYCSPECQRLDWHDGDHRSHCSRYHPQRLSEMQGLKARERAFLRALMAHDYDEAKQKHRYQGGTEPFFTLFDYRLGRVQIEMQPMDSPLAKRLENNSGWCNDVLRAARSGGRLELQVLVLPDNNGTRVFVVPCARKNSSDTNVV
ncbi:hypothetical protein DFH06DRAFT_599053 [Mycena polygramma]|nr:hypothetical protein DFH06DRAFT_599053 [Mycena polygramma]